MNEELKVIISAETEKLRKELEKAQKEVEKLKKKGKASFQEFNDEMQKMGDKAKNACKVMAGAFAGAVTAILALGASTQEYRQQAAKLQTAFEAAGGSAEDAKNTYNDLYRTLGDTDKATEAAAHLAKLTTNEKELNEWTKICQGVYATFGDSLPIEGLTEAANETAKVGTVTGGLADALNWAGVSEDAFNESLAACATEQEREALIRETLNGLYSDAAEKYEKNNAAILAQNEANQKMSDALARVGEAVAPINAALTELAADILAQLEPYITEFAENYLPQITEALSGVGDAIGKVIKWIADNWELVSTLAAVILGIAAAISVVSTVMGVVNAVMMASPVTWIVLGIVAAIAALVAIIVVCVQHWEEIKATVSNVVGAIGKWVSDLWNNLKNGASKAWEAVKSVFSTVANFFGNIFSKAWEKVKAVFTTGGKIFQGIKEGITSVFKTVVNSIIRGINTIISVPFKAINSALSKIRDISIVGLKPFSWISTFSIPQIPELEHGGVLKKGQVGLLEGNGAEAVVPLEKNTEWINKIADKLNSATGAGAPIYLQIDGRTFAQITADKLNQLTLQRGNCPLVIV